MRVQDKPVLPAQKALFPCYFRLHHWIAPVALLVLLFTGMANHFSGRPPGSITGGVSPGWMPWWRFHMFHLLAAIPFFPSLVVMAFSFFRRVPLRKWKTLRRLSEVLLLAGGLLAGGTGLMLLFDGPAPLPVRYLHLLFGLVVLLGFVLHLFVAVKLGWKSIVDAFRFVWQPFPRIRDAYPAFSFSLECCDPFRFSFGSRLPGASGGPDGHPRKEWKALPWEKAAPLRIPISNGMGFEDGRTVVTLRAFHDGNDLFMLADWDDPTEDRVYMPWKRTADGWHRMTTDPNDESVHYEDKFSLIFPPSSDTSFRKLGCAVYCHLGGGHRYGFKDSDEMVDVWHWKAVRSDSYGYVDDKYWHHADMEKADKGRFGDPKEAGGYQKNNNNEMTGPRFLPSEPGKVGKGFIPTKSAVPVTPERVAAIPVGVVIPGIVAGPVTGDRGDVKCISEYKEGRWHLWIRRKLDTGSSFDTPFRPGERHPFGCAAFDCTSKRHAYNHRVYYLELER